MQRFLLIAISAYALLLIACSAQEPPTVNLYRAVHVGDIDQIERNLYWDADVNAPGPDGRSALHVAAEKGRLVVIKILLKNGAAIDQLDAAGQTSLGTALLARRTLAAAYLAKQGARLDANNLLLKTAAAGSLDRDVLDFLLKQGADINTVDDEGNNALHIAASKDQRIAAKHLITGGIDLNAINAAGQTPLGIAQQTGSKDISDMLKRFGVVTAP
ncbi:MAG: ankyrin repeat domain-containing protein [gamma proteobacterium endosymbiont of Lamellibrachia anaximandri]|nr:ankyrin repeat domain-containing protein [gamma proteobacterium endosymbiont of Lamellibrachia anaximandri]MBL3533622.1 ankyrin repeat domain-containing protein [gamma proteobacterium endosymbiont of Lamellibrachia anaximandri]